jgi:hypothetical protein
VRAPEQAERSVNGPALPLPPPPQECTFVPGCQPIGVGRGAVVRRALVDKNVRIGDNVSAAPRGSGCNAGLRACRVSRFQAPSRRADRKQRARNGALAAPRTKRGGADAGACQLRARCGRSEGQASQGRGRSRPPAAPFVSHMLFIGRRSPHAQSPTRPPPQMYIPKCRSRS